MTNHNQVFAISLNYPSGNPNASTGNIVLLLFDAPTISLADLPPIDINPINLGPACSVPSIPPAACTSGIYDNQTGVSSSFREATVVPIPEPSSFALLTVFLTTLVVIRKPISTGGTERHRRQVCGG
jgi:hypothetical protein